MLVSRDAGPGPPDLASDLGHSGRDFRYQDWHGNTWKNTSHVFKVLVLLLITPAFSCQSALFTRSQVVSDVPSTIVGGSSLSLSDLAAPLFSDWLC